MPNENTCFIPQTDNAKTVFDVQEEIKKLPEKTQAIVADEYFSDSPEASSRIFRVYRPLPLHYHNECDEHLYVVSGTGLFHIDGQDLEARPGLFLRFPRKTVHGFLAVSEDPLVVLSVDVPRRRPDDVVFVNPDEATAADFMQRNGSF
ncbi:cupin domain-containing protein [Segniliparus rugosus]|uniref:Cupin type-2 domain-containing protein n=1 Tax=Segniliparus rugosus (strain ATCC BAA-974 / DSM 45345 / CCUG 50838 / CIP 108380 / JCM 13579 / CDC 945) TaxID=679197 RepID=E5XU82_SEGRC|nr:cupin domain-containing protein [Segniliparus rugosus]EFV12081.1 hypothetical protein HMPREF9336_03054 [Segniliparus rugosus ATCC BAA-974]